MRISIIIFFIFITSLSASSKSWIGKWIALDEWKSEFEIVILKGGNARSNYGNGEEGNWSIVDGSVQILWDSGRKDLIFSGVMGIQRYSNFKGKNYTSGMKKLFN